MARVFFVPLTAGFLKIKYQNSVPSALKPSKQEMEIDIPPCSKTCTRFLQVFLPFSALTLIQLQTPQDCEKANGEGRKKEDRPKITLVFAHANGSHPK